MATNVRATGLWSLSPVILGFCGTGMMVECLKHEGTSHSSSDLLKICVKMGASRSAQVFRQAGDTPSGPGAFLRLFFWRPGTRHLLLSVVQLWGRGGRWCCRCEWWFFKPAIELIQIVCQLLILHSAGGWCLVTGNVFHTFPQWSRITGISFVP